MLSEEAPEVTPLVQALTRTPTLFGVPYTFAMFNMVLTAVIFLMTKNLLSLGAVLPIHSIGYFLTMKDRDIFSILQVRASRLPPYSKRIWGVRSYAPGGKLDI